MTNWKNPVGDGDVSSFCSNVRGEIIVLTTNDSSMRLCYIPWSLQCNMCFYVTPPKKTAVVSLDFQEAFA